MKLDNQTQRVVDAATALYGRRWQKPLADAAGVASSSIADLIAEPPAPRRRLTPEMTMRLATALRNEADRLGGAWDYVKLLHDEIVANFDQE